MRKWRVTKIKRKSSLVTCVWQKSLYRIWFEIYIDASSYDTTVTLSSLNWTWNNNDKQSEWQFSFYSAVRFFISQFCNIPSVHSARQMCFCYYDFSVWLGAALLSGRVSKLSIQFFSHTIYQSKSFLVTVFNINSLIFTLLM